MHLSTWVSQRRCIRSVGALLLICAAASERASAQAPPRRITVEVVGDSTQTVLPGSDVSLLAGDRRILAQGVTAASGRVSLMVGAATASSVAIVVRKIGYNAAEGVIAGWEGDTAVRVVLSRQVQTLDGVVTNAMAYKKDYQIGAEEIAHTNRGLFNALIVLEKLRPLMLGDSFRLCGPSDKIWINGQRVMFGPLSMPTVGRGHVGGPPPMTADRSAPTQLHADADDYNPRTEILSTIRGEDIEEMHYLNCWARPPAGLRNDALYITLKPGIAWDWKHGSYFADSVEEHRPE
jgi:hypothetical protein